MKWTEVIFAIFLVFLGLLYMNPPSSYEFDYLLRAAINRANLTIKYCYCQDFSHKEYGWRGPLYIVIHVILFFWWFYEVLKADRHRVRQWEVWREREQRQQLRLLRLNAWLNDGYPILDPEQDFRPDRNLVIQRRESASPSYDEDSLRSLRLREPSFSHQFWRSWSAPP